MSSSGQIHLMVLHAFRLPDVLTCTNTSDGM
jgi:hypothetical protein